MRRSISLLLVTGTFVALLLPAQHKKPDGSALEQALEVKDYKKADGIIKSEIDRFTASANYDTLVHLVPFIGKSNNAQHDAGKAAAAINAHIALLQNKIPPRRLVDAHRLAAEFYASIGQSKYGYDASRLAYEQTLLDPTHTELDVARCEYNLGVYAYRLGDIRLSLPHHRRAIQIRQSNTKTDPEDIYLSSNSLGALMWNASKYDSAEYYYKSALTALSTMPSNDVNRYFRPANVYNNLAALYSVRGETTEGIKAMQQTIANFQKFVVSKDAGPRRQSATEGLFEAMDNLAGIYKEVGDFGKAGELLKTSYQHKKAKLDPGHQGIFISEILLGQYYRDVHEYDSASAYLKSGLSKLHNAEGDYLFWAADAHYSLALMYEDQKNSAAARENYTKSEQLYDQSYQGEYDNTYMDFLRSASLFYAKNNDYPKAFERANNVYKYLIGVGEGSSVQAFHQLLNIAEINYLGKRFNDAIKFSDNAVATINANMKQGITLMDSVKMEVFKPKAILISARSAYELGNKADTAFLRSLSAKLHAGLQLLEKRKVLIDDEKSINILISDNQDIIDFAKEIELRLYELTGSSTHLDKFINLHESALYTRIRARLDKKKAIQFTGLPTVMQQEEDSLKNALATGSENYLARINDWDVHLEKIKKNYPSYYNMRYATIFKPLTDLQSSIPDSTTVIRYYVSDSAIQAILIRKNGRELIKLKKDGLAEKISQLLARNTDEKIELRHLNDLYAMLWQPLAASVQTKKVLIIPDGILYNVSFDMLSPRLCSSYKQLFSHSLLSKHTVAYHYSLFMLGQRSPNNIQQNYVAFAPGFSDELKQAYVRSARDSLQLDQQYLQLLPQPNTNKLAKKIKTLLGGDVFLDTNSTQSVFKSNAKGHKIIHIATHAQYNNVRPERSGLVFAKNTSGEDNYLSLYDLYNCNLESDLTLLTACDSGRPGYQDGEGMVSLAHAFNYAGSESILTSLWEIDEQSCNRITELFVGNIQEGQATDEALRNAKLSYLNTYDGRILAPSYWAGLVLMGEPSIIHLKKRSGNITIIIGALVLAGVLLFFLRQRKKRGANASS